MVAETRLIAAAFPNTRDAQEAVMNLRLHGFPEQDISVLYTDAGHTIRAGLLSGAVWGGVLGALFGLLFPPVGLLIAAGPIAGVLASAAALGAAGALTVGALDGIIAGLIQLGLPREMATSLGERVHKGDTLVIVHARSESSAAMAHQILENHNPRTEIAPESAGIINVAPGAS